MKKLVLIALLFCYNFIFAQYFYNRIGHVLNPDEYDVQLYDGLYSVYNLDPNTNDYFQVGLGTFRKSYLSPPGNNVANRVQFMRSDRTGILNQNYSFQILDPLNQSLIINAEGRSIAEVDRNGYVFCGGLSIQNGQYFPYYYGNGNALFGIIDSTGNMISATSLDIGGNPYGGTDIATCIKRSSFNNNDFLMCGYTYYDYLGKSKSWVAKLRLIGGNALMIVWLSNVDFPIQYSQNGDNRAYSVVDEPSQGRIFICGFNINPSTPNSGKDGMISSFTAAGAYLWRYSYDYSAEEEFRGITYNQTDGLVLTGSNTRAQDNGVPSIWGANVDLLGNVIWSNLYRDVNFVGILHESKGLDIENTINSLGESVYYMAGYGSPNFPTNHVCKILSNGAALANWNDFFTTLIPETNGINFLGCGVAVQNHTFFSPGVTIFSNVSQNHDLNLCLGFHRRTYLNGCACQISPQAPCPSTIPDVVAIPLTRLSYDENSFFNYEVKQMLPVRYDGANQQACSDNIILGGSNARGKSNELQVAEISISQNSGNVIMTVSNVSIHNEYNFRVFNLTGRELEFFIVKGNSSQILDISNYARGIYFITYEKNGEVAGSKKLIIN